MRGDSLMLLLFIYLDISEQVRETVYTVFKLPT